MNTTDYMEQLNDIDDMVQEILSENMIFDDLETKMNSLENLFVERSKIRKNLTSFQASPKMINYK